MKNVSKYIIPPGHAVVRDNVILKGNLIGINRDKAAWAKGLSLPKKAEFMLFAGCGYQFMKYAEGMLEAARKLDKVGLSTENAIGMNKRLNRLGIDAAGIAGRMSAIGKKDLYTSNLVMAVRVLRKLGIDLGYLYDDEPCCGSPLYYSGFVEDFVAHATKSYSRLKNQGVQKIIGLIPACTSALRTVYPRYISPYHLDVKHFLEIVVNKLKMSGIRPTLSKEVVVTYHDPCQLSRYLNIVEEPRVILRLIEGVDFREPDTEKCGKWSTCCGGGGLEMSHPEVSSVLGRKRLEELLGTGADVIVTSCPACLMQLHKEARRLKVDVKIMDLVEILDQALP